MIKIRVFKAENNKRNKAYYAVTGAKSWDEAVKAVIRKKKESNDTYYQYLEKHKRIVPTEISEDLSITEISAERQVLSRVELLDTLRLLHNLPEDMREVIYLRSMGDLSFREIGDIIGKSENWARVTYFRGKTKLIEQSGYQEI